MPRQIQGSQWDFSYGEVDVALKRADNHPARKGGLRQMANARILNSGGIQDRPGRRALYPVTNGGLRTERISLVAGTPIDIQFAPGRVKLINAAGVTIANFANQGNGAALPWASTTDIASIVIAETSDRKIYICFGNAMRPQVISFDGVSTYTIADYAENVTLGGQKRTPFYRLSPQNISIQPSATAGAITIKFSSPIVVAGMAGTRIRFCERQILLGSVIDTFTINATVIQSLPPGQSFGVTGGVGSLGLGDVLKGATSGAAGIVTATSSYQFFNTVNYPGGNQYFVGDAITGLTSGATGIVTSVDATAYAVSVSLNTGTTLVNGEAVLGPHGSAVIQNASSTAITVQLLQSSGSTTQFANAEKVAGPSFSATTVTTTLQPPQSVAIWDEEVINAFRGYPASCFADQFRVGFCDFSAVPGGILWSAINSPADLFANDASSPSNAIFEIAPTKVRVYYVVPGPEGSEFVFTDRRIFYIPISETNPLKPGSVAFKTLSVDGSAQVQPRLAQEAIIYANAGRSSIMAIIATGAYLRPFNTKNLTEFHAHLFSGITAIACPSADGTFNERYAYVLNGDNSISVGKYDATSLASSDVPQIGWGPWSGAGAVSWIGAYAADVIFTSSYFGASLVEILDDAQYLDCALPVNAAPAAFAPPGGKGPLWFIPSQTVVLIDQVTRTMGTYQIDGNGFIVPQFTGGEDLTRADLIAGQQWTMTVEPFAPNGQPGADVHQRMELRQISKVAIYTLNSTGLTLASLFSGPAQTPTSPALGAVMTTMRFPAWTQGEDATKPPILRETVYGWTPPGSSFDPRVAIIKDTPGPLMIPEIAMEISL